MSEQDEKAAIIAITGQVRTMVDGTLRVTIEIEPRQAKDAFTLFGTPGTAVALARISPEVAKGEMQKQVIEQSEKGPYGKSYELLFRNGFFFAAPLHVLLGIESQVEMMRVKASSSRDVAEMVKEKVRESFGVGSLSHIPPEDFRFWLEDAGIEHILPKNFA